MAGPSSPIFGLSPVSPGGVLTATASVRKLGDVYQIERAAQSVPSHEVSCCRYRCSDDLAFALCLGVAAAGICVDRRQQHLYNGCWELGRQGIDGLGASGDRA